MAISSEGLGNSMGTIGISHSDSLSRSRWMIPWKAWMPDDWGRKGKRASCACATYLRVGRGCHSPHPGPKSRARGRSVKRIPREMWVSRDFCLPKSIHTLPGAPGRHAIRTLRAALPVKYYLLGPCPECTCTLDKRLASYILGKDYWRRAAIFIRDHRDFTEKVNHGPEGRFHLSSFWALKVGPGSHSWDTRGAPATWRHWETLKEILKTRWPCGPQERSHQEVSYMLISGLDSWSSPRSLWSLVKAYSLTGIVLWRSLGSSPLRTKCKEGGWCCPFSNSPAQWRFVGPSRVASEEAHWQRCWHHQAWLGSDRTRS